MLEKLSILDKSIDNCKKSRETDKCDDFMMKSSEKNNSNQIKCIICDYRFRNFSDLELHIKDKHIHYQGNDCEKCGKTFVTAWRLKKHMRIHAQNFTKSCKYFKGNVVCPFEELGCKFRHDDDEKDGMTKEKSSDADDIESNSSGCEK